METEFDVKQISQAIKLGRAYLAGPMTGRPKFNFPAFDAAAELLRRRGWEIISPAELDDPATRAAALASPDGAPGSGTANGETWADFLSRDVKVIADEVDAVILLNGWEESKGARLEAFVAALSGHKVYLYRPACNIGIQELPEERLHAILHEAATDQLPPFEPDLIDAAAVESVTKRVEEGFLYGSERPMQQGRQSFVPVAHIDNAVSADPTPRPIHRIEEVRVKNEATGGEKGSKAQRMDLLPWPQLAEVAEHYAKGAEKYAAHNWKRGYDWSLSFGAMQRHAVAWWGRGEEYDEETDTSHLSAIVFHALALLYFRDHFPEGDDRPPTTCEEAQA